MPSQPTQERDPSVDSFASSTCSSCLPRMSLVHTSSVPPPHLEVVRGRPKDVQALRGAGNVDYSNALRVSLPQDVASEMDHLRCCCRRMYKIQDVVEVKGGMNVLAASCNLDA